MNTIPLSLIYPCGELGVRSVKLAARLEDPMYSAADIFNNPSKDWQGDWEGRTILAQTLLSLSTGRHPAYLDEIVAALPLHLNKHGYLGEILPDGFFNEQQMSGHSWLLRGLIAYYYLRHYDWVKEIIHNIVYNLFIPAKNYYKLYPIHPDQRTDEGKESGSITGSVGAWHISSDTGCAFIPIDGISAAYELLGDKEIIELVEEMIRCFLKIDLSAIKAQTHATLTATRGILRIYNINGNSIYLDAAKKIFDLYTDEGMTANYENYNWFGRPEWTEPCAVIDSFIIAMQLYIHSTDVRYIDLAQLIYYNGMCREQRPNGGFGCNSCAIDGVIRNHCYEAFWCCSMRGGEGLACAAQYGYLIDGSRIIIPYLSSSSADIPINGEMIHIEQTTNYPYEGQAAFVISGVTSYDKITLQIYKPGCGEYYIETLSPIKKNINISFNIPLIKSKPTGKYNNISNDMYFHGHLILGTMPDAVPDFSNIKYKGDGKYTAGDAELCPIGDLYIKDKEEALTDKKRILF